MEIYIRPLRIEDALISYKWRNNSKIWELTGSKPDTDITPEIETTWIKDVINRVDEKRFAICIADTNEYVGNVQLTGINNKKAEFHIFIGETQFWGKGIGENATKLVLEYGFSKIDLLEIFLTVNEQNLKAIKIYKKLSFMEIGLKLNMIEMSIIKDNFLST